MKQGRENKPHIAIFGACNVGKSTLLNFLTDADISIVSPQSGTTTDAVKKSYEILDFAPVVFIDTAGLDDDSELGRLRISRSYEVLSQSDMVLLVFREWGACERRFHELLQSEGVPFIAIRNLFPGLAVDSEDIPQGLDVFNIDVLQADGVLRGRLMDLIKKSLPEQSYTATKMFGGRIREGETVLLVCPIDGEAPSGRLILPQVQALRELLDAHAVAITVQPAQIEAVFAAGVTPRMVVTDSQVYAEVRRLVPQHIELTSFSILLAAAKGDVDLYIKGLERVDALKDGDRVLINESCSHQISCEDIGRVKIPRWLEEYCGCKLSFTFITSADALPDDLTDNKLMVQCGGCMVTRRALLSRIRKASAAGVAVTNYGMLIKKCR